MHKSAQQQVIADLKTLIADGERIIATFHVSDWGANVTQLPAPEVASFVINSTALVERITGRDSAYLRPILAAEEIHRHYLATHDCVNAALGALKALLRAIENDWLTSLEQRLRANVHDDFMIQAEELLKANYHVGAMVLLGGVLENHLRSLCNTRGLLPNGSGSLSKYNEALRDKTYDQPTWRRIQAIADLRNQAAHGQGSSVKPEDVADSLRFITRILTEYAV